VKRLVIASTNAGKLREVSMALADVADWSVESLHDLPDIEETGASFLENAQLKAEHYSKFIDALVLADDSGLCVHALDNRPGIHSARYAPSTSERNDRLLKELDELGSGADRTATFYCAFVVARAGKHVWSVDRKLEGSIALQPTGEYGFGYDPLFFVPELNRTLAELSAYEKNEVSARGQALRDLREFLLEN
jgi:XTP/dITP diphosphohydrolase